MPDLLDNYLDLPLLADADGVSFTGRTARLSIQRARPARAGFRRVADEPWFRRRRPNAARSSRRGGDRNTCIAPFDYRLMDHAATISATWSTCRALTAARRVVRARAGPAQLVLDRAREVLVSRAGLPSAAVF